MSTPRCTWPVEAARDTDQQYESIVSGTLSIMTVRAPYLKVRKGFRHLLEELVQILSIETDQHASERTKRQKADASYVSRCSRHMYFRDD